MILGVKGETTKSDGLFWGLVLRMAAMLSGGTRCSWMSRAWLSPSEAKRILFFEHISWGTEGETEARKGGKV